MAYYTKKELTNIGVDAFALIDEFYGGAAGGRKGRKQQQLPNYAAHARPLPPPPPAAATLFVARNHYSTASSSGYCRRPQYQGYNYYRYSPSESHVGWAPAVAMTAETTTVVRGGYEAGDAEILMDSYKY